MVDIQSPLNAQYDGPVARSDQIGRPSGANAEAALASADAVAAVLDPASTLDTDREYQADPTGTKGYSVAPDGTFLASSMRVARGIVRRAFAERVTLIDRLGRSIGGMSAVPQNAGSILGDDAGVIAQVATSDGAVEMSVVRAERGMLRRASAERLTLLDRLGKFAGGLSIVPQAAAGVSGDATGVIAQTIASDGATELPALRADRATVRFLQATGMSFIDRLGRITGGLSVSNLFNKTMAITDAGDQLALHVRNDGTVEAGAISSVSLRGAGGRLSVGAGYMLEARLRPTGRREIWLSDLSTGTRRKLSNDSAADFLDPQLLPASPVVPVPMCLCLKRRGGGDQFIALPLTGTGIEAPVRASPSILFHGDSFLNNGMGPAIIAGLNVRRPSVVINSGGSWLEAAVARLGGGSVATSKAGSNPAAAGGVQNGDNYVYPGVPQYWGHTYVHIEGGYEDLAASSDPATAVAPIIARFRQLELILTPAVRQVVIAQSGINRDSTPAQVAFKLACDALIAAAFPANWVPTYDYMRANGTGALIGSGGGAVWPADTYTDVLHPTPDLLGTAVLSGVQLYAAPISAFLNARSY